MKLKCFIPDCISGDAKLKDLDAYVEYWHQNQPTPTLREFLGLTEFEYSQWGVRSDRIFMEILYCRKRNIDYQRFLIAHPGKNPRKQNVQSCQKIAQFAKENAELKIEKRKLTKLNDELAEQNAKLLDKIVEIRKEVDAVVKEKAQAIKNAALSNETLSSITKTLQDKCAYLERRIAKFSERIILNLNKQDSEEFQNAKANHAIASAELERVQKTIAQVNAAKDVAEGKPVEEPSVEEVGTPLEQAMEALFLESICKNIICGSQRCECNHVWIEGCQRYQKFKADLEQLANKHLGIE